jgi:hypothetical protein
MTKAKKKATEMTTEELARRVFPKKVVDELKKIAHANDEKEAPQKPDPDSSRPE